MQDMDYYKTLGVTRQASAETIKAAYRRLARKYHPDVSKEPGAEARFKEVTEAYETLRDPRRRNAYDQLDRQRTDDARHRHSPPPENPRQADSAADRFFRNLFGSSRAARRTGRVFGNSNRKERRRGPGGAYRQISITLSLEDASHGATKEVTVPGNRVGSRSRTLRVKIPPGVQDGQQIRLADSGGDVYLKINVAPHRLLRVNGQNVHLDLPIAPWEAALGANIQVPTLAGPLELRIPANSQSGRQLRLKGRGVPGSPPGDQYVHLQIVTPPASDPDTRQLYEQLRTRSRFNPRKAFD